ncbi:hypothetical protein [Nocardioides convexus]|uniref:hypothetical protein n=1 Tax=Nocardioides convexus TaxID=2712224 RepID=UPI0031014931
MRALRFSGPVLPDGETREVFVLDGRITYERPSGAETAAEGWIVPGLVDAHNHLGLEDGGAVSEEEIERTAILDRADGVLLTRDCGSPADTRWVQEREDLPRLIRCGRHVARTRRYLKGYGAEVEPEEPRRHRRRAGPRGRRLGQAWSVTGSLARRATWRRPSPPTRWPRRSGSRTRWARR